MVPAVNQVEVHPYFTQAPVQAADAAHGILTQAWSPIGGITSYRSTGTSTFDDPAIAAIAATHGETPAQVMIRWVGAGAVQVISSVSAPTVACMLADPRHARCVSSLVIWPLFAAVGQFS